MYMQKGHTSNMSRLGFIHILFTCMLSSGLFTSYWIPTCLSRWNRRSVLKCWHLRYLRRWITQKKEYISQNTAKVLNQEKLCFHSRNFWILPRILKTN
jgi:hypothetical protein